MTYTLIGTGNMAYFLAHKLKEGSFMCKGVYGRDEVKAKALASIAGADISGHISEVTENSDCCILAVTDSAIAAIAQSLKFNKTVLIHTAGSQPLSLLPAKHRGVLWCVYSILKQELPDHRNIPVVIEAETEETKDMLHKLAAAISDTVYEANAEQRLHLHMAAVWGNNFTNHLMAVCEAICLERGLPFSLLRPILEQTYQRTTHQSPALLQTGPAKRGDTNTMQRHMEQLSNHPEWQEVYKSISASIENWYKQAHS